MHITKEGSSRYASVRKSRLVGFPDRERLPWSYDAFADRYGRDVIEGVSIPVAVAAKEVVAEIERLLAIVKLPEGWADKVLTAAGAGAWSELSAEQADKSLAYLNQKIVAGA